MARGKSIIVSTNPQGKFVEGIISGTPKPGTVVTIKPGVALGAGSKFTWEPAGVSAGLMGADGDRIPIGVLLPDSYQGKTESDAYADGDRCFIYFPIPGEELNVLLQDQAGTADDITIGQKLIVDDGTGKVYGTTGTPQQEPFIALEAVTDPTADQLVWTQFAG